MSYFGNYFGPMTITGGGGTSGEVSNFTDAALQQIRDAMKRAPSAGAASAESIDAKLDSVSGGGTGDPLHIQISAGQGVEIS